MNTRQLMLAVARRLVDANIVAADDLARVLLDPESHLEPIEEPDARAAVSDLALGMSSLIYLRCADPRPTL